MPQAPGKPRPTGEIEEVGAAPHGDMLAGIDEPATDGIIERGGAAPDPPPRLEHRHPTAPLDERRGSRQAGQARTDDNNMRRGGSLHHESPIPRGPVATDTKAAPARSIFGGLTRKEKIPAPLCRTAWKMVR